MYLQRLSGEAEFVVDHLDQRFWSLHTTAPTADAAPYLCRVVNQRRDLDWMWLPSDHLRGIWRDVSPLLVATNFSAGRLTPTIGEVDDLKLRVSGRDTPVVVNGTASGARTVPRDRTPDRKPAVLRPKARRTPVQRP